MIPAAFGYQRPASLDEALRIIAANGGAKVLAGGMSLLPLLKLRLGSAETLVDIGRLSELKGIRQLADGRLAIGPLTTYRELAESSARHYGVLEDALPGIGDLQVRNRGTIGGAIAHADPASDLPACLLALDAELVARSARGERTIPVDGFFKGPFETALDADEILTEIRLPGPRDDAGSAYSRLEQTASGYAMVGAAAVVFVGADRRIAGANVALAGVGRPCLSGAGGRSGAGGFGWVGGVDRGRRGPRDRWRRGRRRHPCRQARTGPRWPRSTPAVRSRPPSPGWAERTRPRVRVERVTPGQRAPARLVGAILARDLTVAGDRWSKGRRLTADDLPAAAASEPGDPVTVLLPEAGRAARG